MTTVTTQSDIDNLSQTTGSVYQYSFNNPESINGPFGSFEVYFGASPVTGGKMTITTIFGLGTNTEMVFLGRESFNGSTGYTSIEAEGVGAITAIGQKPKVFTAKVTIELKPGLESGTVSVENFFKNLPCQLVKAVNHESKG